ncbi:MAG: hypothetical protein NC116_10485 [Clostridium sp.]|nr:hypothetical protein [Clostridium sp.]
MIHFHLLGEELLQQVLFVQPVKNELYGSLCLDFNRRFTVLGIVEPGFRPPPQSRIVGIDGE